VPQLDVVEQLEQEELPAIGADTPSAPFEKEANLESTFPAGLSHLGHEAAEFDWVIDRNNSNLLPQPEQQYSYKGIIPSSINKLYHKIYL
jgi:hypothetical protein